MAAVRFLVVGAGGRGSGYAGYIRQHPDEAQVVGVAEPRPFYRQRLATEHVIPENQARAAGTVVDVAQFKARYAG